MPAGRPVEELDAPAQRTVLWVTLGAAAVLIGLFGALLVADRDEVSNPRVGQAAPAIRSTTIDGAPFDLDDLLGQWVVVNFFATWCPPCRAEHPELVDFVERQRNAGEATLVTVAFNEPTEVIAAYFDDNGGDWPVVTDPNGRIAISYGVLSVPESFLISPSGFVVWAGTGGVTADGLDSLIDQATAATEITPE